MVVLAYMYGQGLCKSCMVYSNVAHSPDYLEDVKGQTPQFQHITMSNRT